MLQIIFVKNFFSSEKLQSAITSFQFGYHRAIKSLLMGLLISERSINSRASEKQAHREKKKTKKTKQVLLTRPSEAVAMKQR